MLIYFLCHLRANYKNSCLFLNNLLYLALYMEGFSQCSLEASLWLTYSWHSEAICTVSELASFAWNFLVGIQESIGYGGQG